MTASTPIVGSDMLGENQPTESITTFLARSDNTPAISQSQEYINSGKRQEDAWNVVRASVRGTGHIKNGIPCQDYNNYEVVAGEFVIVAVADGVGTAPKADEGAKLAVEAFLSSARKALDDHYASEEDEWLDIVANAFQDAKKDLEREAHTKFLKPEAYGTTLIAVILGRDWLVTGHIGDGGAVALFANKQLMTISPPQRGEYVNQVVPLTDPDALDVARFSARNIGVDAVALFTDGIQHLALNNSDDSAHPPFFASIFEEMPIIKDCEKASLLLAEYLASERVSSRTDDDKTLILVGRKSI